MRLALACLVTWGLAWVLTGRLRVYAMRKNILDQPNERSAHKVPTPRGGGLGFIIAYYVGLVGAAAFRAPIPRPLDRILLGSIIVAVIGWLDDRSSLSPKVRLIFHFAGTFVLLGPLLLNSALLGNSVAGLHLGWPSEAGAALPLAAHLPVAVVFVLACVWILNLYNFMDGIDGIAGIEALTAALALGGLNMLAYGAVGLAWAWAYFLLAAAIAGFLLLNWPPARIFMGDVGSGFLGLLFAGMAIWSSATGGAGLCATLIMLGVFIVDSTYTLIDRYRQGKKVSQSHCEHAYQHASRRWGHKPVTLATTGINIFWLAPLAVLATVRPALQIVALVVAYAPLVFMTMKCKQFGKPT